MILRSHHCPVPATIPRLRRCPHDPALAFALDTQWRRGVVADRRACQITASGYAVIWWTIWLQLEDQMPNEETIEHRTVCWMATYTTNYKLDVAALWGEQFILSRAPPASCPARPRRLGPRAMATYGQASPTRLGAAGIYLPTGRRHMLTELACLPARIRICVEPTTRRGTEGALHQAVRPQRSNEPAERAAQAQVPRHPLQLRRVRRVPSWAHVRSSPWHALWPATGTACALPARARARSVLCTLPLPALTTRLTHSILYLSALLHTSDVQLHVHTLPSHRRKFEAARDRRAPQAELLAIQEERIAHRQWWRAERMVSEKVLGEAGE